MGRKNKQGSFELHINTEDDVARMAEAARAQAARSARYQTERAAELATRRDRCPTTCHRGCICR